MVRLVATIDGTNIWLCEQEPLGGLATPDLATLLAIAWDYRQRRQQIGAK